ncbi:putative protein phosphatase 2C 8 [Bienertia sinuspersici]
MTLREVPLPEGISSSAVHKTITDSQKAKLSRRRRLEIQRLKSSCREAATDGDDDGDGDTGDSCGVHGAVSVMGRRREMEDAVSVEKGFYGKYDYFGVYDGHGGSNVAEECRNRMHAIVREEVERGDTWRKKKGSGFDEDDDGGIDWEMVMGKCFERMDEEVGEKGNCGNNNNKVEEMTVGSTVVVAIVGREEVVVANCGDSRAVICRNGDYYLKPYVSSMPEVTISKRTEADEFIILASDGLWDVISNEVACQVVRRCLSGRIKSQEIFNQISKISNNRAEVAAVLLTELAMAKGSKDNISVIVVELKKFRRFGCS